MESIFSENALWNYSERIEGTVDTREYVAFYWNKMDGWFEEEEEVFGHARDPYKRVEVLRSSRHVEVVLNGVSVAETEMPMILLETGLPRRFYLPRTNVRTEFLRPGSISTVCPYKGEASYFSLEVGDELHVDLAWYYQSPNDEVAKIKDYICFPQGKVNLFVDGELEERPNTKWDKP
mgnify:CR=1 FL=1